MAKSEYILGYSPWGNGKSITPFDEVFSYAVDVQKDGFDAIDALVLWGGQDIHPSYYGETAHPCSQANAIPSIRDEFEWKSMQICKAMDIPIIGVCRGAQFLCVFNGGKLFQHVNGHNSGPHMVVTTQGDRFRTTSLHHQMMDLRKTNHELLAWCDKPLSDYYHGQKSLSDVTVVADTSFKEPEVVYFPDNNSLAIQGHPEYMKSEDLFVKWCNETISTFLLNNKVYT